MNSKQSVTVWICLLHNHFYYALQNYLNVSSVLLAKPVIAQSLLIIHQQENI